MRGVIFGFLFLRLMNWGEISAADDVGEERGFTLGYHTPVHPALQRDLEKIDATLRAEFGIPADSAAVGLLDLTTARLALIQPDREMYAASLPKNGILLAWFDLHPEAATCLDDQTRRDLGLMIKASSNEAATQFSRQLGLKKIQEVLNRHGFYDAAHGGGLWIGKHYGRGGERYGDPVGDNSHAATVRQLLRYFLLLEQEQLLSPAASRAMREIFESPEIPHDPIKFVQGLAGRDLQIIRKWGSWEDWHHDAAVITGPGRHYILAALTHHPRGDDYLAALAPQIDNLLSE